MDINIKIAFDNKYTDEFNLLQRKPICFFTFKILNTNFHIRLSMCGGIYSTVVFLVEVLREEIKEFIKLPDLNKYFHKQTKAVGYIIELLEGENYAEQRPK